MVLYVVNFLFEFFFFTKVNSSDCKIKFREYLIVSHMQK